MKKSIIPNNTKEDQIPKLPPPSDNNIKRNVPLSGDPPSLPQFIMYYGLPSIIKIQTNQVDHPIYHTVVECPNPNFPIFLTLGRRIVSLWSVNVLKPFRPLCLLAVHERPKNFVEETGGGFIRIVDWDKSSWRQFFIVVGDGSLQCFEIADVQNSILPVKVEQVRDKAILATMSLGLIFVKSTGPTEGGNKTGPGKKSSIHELPDGFREMLNIIDSGIVRDSLILLNDLKDQSILEVVEVKNANQIVNSSISSKLAILSFDYKILHLRITPNLFSSNVRRESSSINIRDPYLLWENIDIPFEIYLDGGSNGPIRQSVVDQNGQWIVVVGKFGFCLCNLSLRNWRLFSDVSLERSIVVHHSCWVTLSNNYTILVVICLNVSSLQHELWILSPEMELSEGNLLHKQVITLGIESVYMCSLGYLTLLSKDKNLQIVHLSQSNTGDLEMNIVLRASLLKILPDSESLLKKILFVPSPLLSRDHALFTLSSNGDLNCMLFPNDNELSLHDAVLCKIIDHTCRDAFIIQIGGMDFLLVFTDDVIMGYCYPFKSENSFAISDSKTLNTFFYPSIAGGLCIRLCQSEPQQESTGLLDTFQSIEIGETFSIIPPVLLYVLERSKAIDFSEFFKKTFDQFVATEKHDQFVLIIEVLFLEILLRFDKNHQSCLYEQLQLILPVVIGGSCYRQAVSNFLRKIELNDSQRILSILGPFSQIFSTSLRMNELQIAWSVFRIFNLDGITFDEAGFRDQGNYRKIIKAALYELDLSIFNISIRFSVDTGIKLDAEFIKELISFIVSRRAWPFLIILHTEKIQFSLPKFEKLSWNMVAAIASLYSPFAQRELLRSLELADNSKSESELAQVLDDYIEFEEEKALWIFFIECNPWSLQRLLSREGGDATTAFDINQLNNLILQIKT